MRASRSNTWTLGSAEIDVVESSTAARYRGQSRARQEIPARAVRPARQYAVRACGTRPRYRRLAVRPSFAAEPDCAAKQSRRLQAPCRQRASSMHPIAEESARSALRNTRAPDRRHAPAASAGSHPGPTGCRDRLATASITLDYLDLYGLRPSVERVKPPESPCASPARAFSSRAKSGSSTSCFSWIVRILVRSAGLLDAPRTRNRNR